MKIQKEIISLNPGQSFKIFSPSLRNNFYWHYHPEIELLYVEAITGIRHVGQHISSFTTDDLVLIGPDIPHLNFDYGIQTDYHQIVVQFRENFLGDALKTAPEFEAIEDLMKRSIYGLSFFGPAKEQAIEKLKNLGSQSLFVQMLTLLEIFQLLASTNDYIQLNDRDTRVKIFLDDKIRMASVYDYIHLNYDKKPDVNEIAACVHLSTAAFCRYFKKQTKMTFTDFVNQYRITQAKTLLMKDITVSEACYEVGFESLSYFNKLFKKLTGVNPSKFRKHF